MKHQLDPLGNRPPGPHPSEKIPPSEVLARRRAFLEISDFDVEGVRGLAGLFDGGDLGCYVEGTLALVKLLLLDMGLDPDVARSTEHPRSALRLPAQSNARLKDFAHLASHELKTPLATVASLCEEFLDEFGPQVPAEGRALIEAARSKTLKLGRMINELLEVSEAGTQTNGRVHIATRRLLDEVLERLHPEIEGRSIQISVPDHMPEIHAHPSRLREVFYHVLSNAIKFLDKEDGVIRVGTETAHGEHIFSISDNGPGIAEAELPQIFAPFRRLPQHRNKPGSGLGLYFVKTFVEEEGGHVWVQSHVGEGTQFYIALPAQGLTETMSQEQPGMPS